MDWLAVLRLGLVTVASSLAGSLVFRSLFKTKTKAKPNEIKPPSIFIYIGILLNLILIIMIYFSLKSEDDIGLSIVIAPFLLVGFFLIIHGCFWRIYLGEDTFVHKNRVGCKKEYRYDAITNYKYKKYGTIWLYLGKKRIIVDFCNSNLDVLNMLLYEKFRKPKTPYISPQKRKKLSKAKNKSFTIF